MDPAATPRPSRAPTASASLNPPTAAEAFELVPPVAADADEIELVHVESPEQCAELARVLADVWGFFDASAVASPDTLRAMAYSGCYVAGAVYEGRLIGGGFGWPTRVDEEWRLHSHVIGFLDGFRAMGLGARIKHHQRDFVRAKGMDAIEWTFDPLHAANAKFNLVKLGARVQGFHHDFYGNLQDEFSAGLGTDRFVVRWGVDDLPPTDQRMGEETAREPILAVGGDGSPVITPSTATAVFAELPSNIVNIRKNDRALAMEWHLAFAETVGRDILAGARVTGLRTGDGSRVSYLIDR